jgi:hypothetical protein
MIFKKQLILLIGVCITIMLSSCVTSTIFDTDQQAILSIRKSKTVYSDNNAKKYSVINGNQYIEYVDGIDSLKTSFLKEYYLHCNNGSEYNMFERVYILFNSQLEIKEVRIQKRPMNMIVPYEKFIVNFFENTNGKWKYKNNNSKNAKWYVYGFSCRIF